jgi:ER membrane protein complex subunit 7
MRLLVFLAAIAHSLAFTLAASIRINIPPSTLLPNPNILPASTHATLTTSTGPELRAVIRKGNYIEFPSIPTSGSHLLQIYSRDYTFAPYRIDVSSSSPEAGSQIIGAFETYHGTQWSDHGIQLTPNGQPTTALTLNAKVLSKKNFYETRPGFNVLSLLKNPMILMGGVALLFTFGMPKLMENMDPEMKAEYEEMQKKSPVAGLASAMQGGGAGGAASGFDLAGFLAGKQSDSGGAEGAASSGSTKGNSGGIRERKR